MMEELRMFRSYLFLIFILAFLFPSLSNALEISVHHNENGPLGVTANIYLSGPIMSGDADRVWNTIRALDFQGIDNRLHVTMDSPGGVVTEALTIGRALNALPRLVTVTVTTSVGRESKKLLPLSGDCASACVLIYLGGTYRYLDSKSRLGVHQFSFGASGVNSEDATALSQLLAADVVEYLQENRIDTSFFSAMSKTAPSGIDWVDHDELRRMKVVNENVSDEISEYKNVDGHFYLLLEQQSYYGLNKLVVACYEKKMVFVTYLQSPEISDASLPQHTVEILIDGVEVIPTQASVPAKSGMFKTAEFSLDQSQIRRLASARSVGARMVLPGAPVFFGFEMNVPDNKLRDIISGCRA